MTMKLLGVTTLLCAGAILMFVVGGERLTLSAYCWFWRFTEGETIAVEGISLRVPRGWCQIDSTNGVTLTSVPNSRRDTPIVALAGHLPERIGSRLPDVPERTQILDEKMVLIGDGASPRQLGELSAFRIQYAREDSDRAESYVAWLFPDQDLMISSLRVPKSKEALFDNFVAELVSE